MYAVRCGAVRDATPAAPCTRSASDTVLTSNCSASRVHVAKVRYLIAIEMVFSDYAKQRIVFYSSKGLLSMSILKELRKEGTWSFSYMYLDSNFAHAIAIDPYAIIIR